MKDFVVRQIVTDNIEHELELVGFDSSYINSATEKYQYKNFKIYDLSLPQANILKQTALSLGADCAVHKNVLTGNIEKTDVIVGGSISQIKKIAEKLQNQPFSLKNLGNLLISKTSYKQNKTKLVGILNITPDSFSDGGLYYNQNDAIKHLEELINDGADIADIGAESTRPSAKEIPSEEQIKRLAPILKYIEQHNIKIPISIDTRCSKVAEFALDKGINYINDVSGFDHDPNMPKIIGQYSAGAIIQHSRLLNKEIDIIDDIYLTLKEKIDIAKSNNIQDIIIDVGIGFNKTKDENFEIIKRIEDFYSLNYPLMIGVSRKSLLGLSDIDDNNLKDSLSAAISYPLMLKGISYLRVHNVKLHKQLLNLVK